MGFTTYVVTCWSICYLIGKIGDWRIKIKTAQVYRQTPEGGLHSFILKDHKDDSKVIIEICSYVNSNN